MATDTKDGACTVERIASAIVTLVLSKVVNRALQLGCIP